jgi:hypothetical protein
MKKILFIAMLFMAFTQTTASAQGGRNRMLKARYDSLSPEQKKQFQDRLKARRDSLTPEQRKEIRKKMKDRYDQMSPEEQKEWKDKIKQRADSLGIKPGRMHRRGLRG